jgi:hypothetical protein
MELAKQKSNMQLLLTRFIVVSRKKNVAARHKRLPRGLRQDKPQDAMARNIVPWLWISAILPASTLACWL